MSTLDFLGIGATKAGTTSFFYYIKDHPQLCLPFEKEIFFFDKMPNGDWDTFFNDNFNHCEPGQMVGKISPRYMRDPGVPARVAARFPDVKIFVILRDPVERAFSHYKMLFRMGTLKESFDDLVERQLAPASLERARTVNLEGEHSLLVQGEYARILEGYRAHFKNILVLFTEEMEKDPVKALDTFYDFIGVKPFYPENIGKKYFVGGDKDRFPWLFPALKLVFLPRLLWRLIPAKYRKQIMIWYNINFRIQKKKSVSMNEATRARLVEFYGTDVARLQVMLKREVPWLTFQSSSVSQKTNLY
jgi:hypothetical protein